MRANLSSIASAEVHRHHMTDEVQLNARADVTDWVKATYGTLLAMSRGPEQEEHHRALDQVSAEFNKAAAAFGLLLAGEIDDAQVRIHEADARVAAIADERDAPTPPSSTAKLGLAETDRVLTQARQLATNNAARADTG